MILLRVPTSSGVPGISSYQIAALQIEANGHEMSVPPCSLTCKESGSETLALCSIELNVSWAREETISVRGVRGPGERGVKPTRAALAATWDQSHVFLLMLRALNNTSKTGC